MLTVNCQYLYKLCVNSPYQKHNSRAYSRLLWQFENGTENGMNSYVGNTNLASVSATA